MEYTLNIRGQLMDLTEPKVMGILNVTPDSFYADSRTQTKQTIVDKVRQLVGEGAALIDVGACSTRPGCTPVSEQEETERLRMALRVVRSEFPDVVLSVDTFRPDVARMVVGEFGVDMINDIGGQSAAVRLDMFRVVSRLGVPYVLMSQAPTLRQMLLGFAEDIQQLRDLGQKDIILDPGFGFGKSLEQNYEVMSQLERLLVMELPVLVGVSRKSMINRVLGTIPSEALNGTTVLHTLALQKGASILRVHDVRAAVETVRLFSLCSLNSA